ncbi:30S ribosomal protein S1 [Candidatus Dependentiae bacterium]|nr:30S ribosomal protein S1 [Candidatus Dependentiae bacterium]MCG2756656.1 30S ribosomal protein S1 [Candidatus Dependentiae bacterium]
MQNNSNEELISPLLNTELLDETFQLNEKELEDLSALYKETLHNFEVGKIIKGRILHKENNGVTISIDYKSDGFIPSYEFSEIELKRLNVNDEIDVILDRVEDEFGNVVLSYQKAKAIKAWEIIANLAEKDEPVTGVVTHKVKGGLSVDIGIPAFLPGSQIDTQRITNFDQFVGQEVTGKILKVNKKRGNVIMSRRKYLEEQRQVDKKKALENIEIGQVIQGIVKNITSYGVFVDVGGIDGLLHITDMSWGRITHPSEMLKIGDEVTVKVLSFDKEFEKISLGIKQLFDNPWAEIDKKYPVASIIKGRISSITDYGLFVEVEKGVEGLVHISEISWTERITNLSKHYNVNDQIEVKVVALDKDNRRMSLSIKQLSQDPWKEVADKFKIGDKIKGKITNITDFGIFVQLLEGVDGLVHISDISWTNHLNHPSEKYKKGDEVEALVLAVDSENKKVSLGIKQLGQDPWTNIETNHPVGSEVEGRVSKITNFGAFVKLDSGIEGLIHISEMADNDVEKVEDILKVGDVKKFKVVKVNEEEKKLGLSLRTTSKQPKESAKVHKEASAPKARRSGSKGSESDEQVKTQEDTKRPKSALQQALEAHMNKDK